MSATIWIPTCTCIRTGSIHISSHWKWKGFLRNNSQDTYIRMSESTIFPRALSLIVTDSPDNSLLVLALRTVQVHGRCRNLPCTCSSTCSQCHVWRCLIFPRLSSPLLGLPGPFAAVAEETMAYRSSTALRTGMFRFLGRR